MLRRPRVLPGILPGGEVQLPNQWSLRPAGKHFLVGDFPVNMALHPSGDCLAVLHAGYGEHEIVIVDLRHKRQHVACRVPLEQTFYGLCFSPDGNTLFASGAEFEVVHAFAFEDGLLSRPRQIAVAALKDKFIPAGIAVTRTARRCSPPAPGATPCGIVPLDDPRKGRQLPLDKDSLSLHLPAGAGR